MSPTARAALLAAGILAGGPAPGTARDLREIVPAALLAPGERELKLFHNVYTQTAFFDAAGERREQGSRSTWATSTATLRWGWRPRINPELEITARSVADGRLPAARRRRSGLTAVTPAVQFAPLAAHRGLSVRAALRVPLGGGLEGSSREPFLDFANPMAIAEALATAPLGAAGRLDARAGARLRLSAQRAQLTTPLLALLTLEPRSFWTLYAPLEIFPEWLGEGAGDYFLQTGLGAKLRPGSGSFEIEALWTFFPAGRDKGAGQSFSLGLRIVRAP